MYMDTNTSLYFDRTGSSKRKKAEEKKRKHHPEAGSIGDKKKKAKLEIFPPAEPGDSNMSEHDKNVLDRWKRIQQTTRPFVHPIRKLVVKSDQENGTEGGGLACSQQQEQLLKQQSEQIEKQQKQITQQQQLIRSQQEKIRLLQEQQKALISECRAAGIKIPPIISQDVPAIITNQHDQLQLPTNVHRSGGSDVIPSQPPPHPPPQPQAQPPITPAQPINQPPSYPNISPPNPTHAQPLPHHGPQPVKTPPPPQSVGGTTMSHLPLTQPMPPHSVSRQFAPPAQVPVVASTVSPHINLNQTTQRLPTRTLYPTSEGVRTTNPMVANFSFSPLTSSELQELESQNLPSYSPNPVNTYDPFPCELDSILNITVPTGSGAGYGVGVMEEELPIAHPQLDLR